MLLSMCCGSGALWVVCQQSEVCDRDPELLRIADARWGRPAHITFFIFCIMTNILVTSMLLLGGAAVMNSLTGMNIYAVGPRLSALTKRCILASAGHDEHESLASHAWSLPAASSI